MKANHNQREDYSNCLPAAAHSVSIQDVRILFKWRGFLECTACSQVLHNCLQSTFKGGFILCMAQCCTVRSVFFVLSLSENDHNASIAVPLGLSVPFAQASTIPPTGLFMAELWAVEESTDTPSLEITVTVTKSPVTTYPVPTVSLLHYFTYTQPGSFYQYSLENSY